MVCQRIAQEWIEAPVSVNEAQTSILRIQLKLNDYISCVRLIRNPDETSDALLLYDRPYDSSADYQLTPCPVKKGSLVLIHGFVVHSSEANKSSKSRHAYTFHVMETDNVHYSEKNWLQYPKGESFPVL